jgi:competence protein ComEA
MINPITARIAFALAIIVPALSFAATPVNVNQASAATIAKSLDGIGASRAQAIVAWRDAHGPFKTVDDLGHVKGIGKSTLARNRDAILLADASPAAASPDATEEAAPVSKDDAAASKARNVINKVPKVVKQ